MKKVAHILSRKGMQAIAVERQVPVLEALRIMAEKNIGSILVMKENVYLGLMTERDYARKVILKGKSSSETKVEDIMETDLPHITPEDSIEYCMQLMSEKNIRYLPVFDNAQLCGIISINDVVKEALLAQQETIEQLHHYIHS